jgi:hypothetical protein
MHSVLLAAIVESTAQHSFDFSDLMHMVRVISSPVVNKFSYCGSLIRCGYACRIVSLPANLDFMIFNHRRSALPSDADLKLKT